MGKSGERFHEIDAIKGLACLMMLFGHTFRSRMPLPTAFDKVLLHFMDLAAPMFFFVSGMNVMTFIDNNRAKRSFAAVKFYLASAALLFALGFTYNLNRGSMKMMDVFQCVALGTAITFLLMRTRLPTVVHWLLATAMLVVPLVFFRLPLEVSPVYAAFRVFRASVPWASDLLRPGMADAIRELFARTPAWKRWLFMQYGPLPWTGFFYLGALCYRSVITRGTSTRWWWPLFIIALAVGPFAGRELFGRGLPWLDAITLHTFLDMMLRGFPSFLLMGLGLSGVIYLGSRRWYRGPEGYRDRLARWLAAEVEYLGRESFMFLILHWLLISLSLALAHLQGLATFLWDLPEITLSPYGRVALVTAGVVLLIPPLARLRDRLARWEFFRPAMFAVMIASVALSYPIGWFLRSMEARLMVTYGASLAFAFVYPTLRADLRRHFTTPANVVDNPPAPPPS